MLQMAQEVGGRLIRDIGRAKYYNLQNIVYAVEACTAIDKVVYIGFNVSPQNPILGQFRKYARIPTAYASSETIVEIRYAMHLSKNWYRFVVCKELCHSLEFDEGTYSASPRSIDRILSRFSLLSASKPIATSFPAFDAETLAEFGALEMLCPVSVRKELYETDTQENLCRRFGIPSEYSFLAFDADMIDVVESIL